MSVTSWKKRVLHKQEEWKRVFSYFSMDKSLDKRGQFQLLWTGKYSSFCSQITTEGMSERLKECLKERDKWLFVGKNLTLEVVFCNETLNSFTNRHNFVFANKLDSIVNLTYLAISVMELLMIWRAVTSWNRKLSYKQLVY